MLELFLQWTPYNLKMQGYQTLACFWVHHNVSISVGTCFQIQASSSLDYKSSSMAFELEVLSYHQILQCEIDCNPLMVFNLIFSFEANVTKITNFHGIKLLEFKMQDFKLILPLHKQVHLYILLSLLVLLLLWQHGSQAYPCSILFLDVHYQKHHLYIQYALM